MKIIQYAEQNVCLDDNDKTQDKIDNIVHANDICIFLKGSLMQVVILFLAVYIIKLKRRECFEIKILITMSLSYGILAILFGV